MPHLDEGTIHAWLDGALTPQEQRLAEAHAAECESCAASVAEARGLVAASSRILSSLDDVPAGVIPAATVAARGSMPAGARRGIAVRRWVASPAMRVAAAVLLVATGTVFVTSRERATRDVSTMADETVGMENKGVPGKSPAPVQQDVLAEASQPVPPPSPKPVSPRTNVREGVVATSRAKSSTAAVANSTLADAVHLDTMRVAQRVVAPARIAAGKEAPQAAGAQSAERIAIAEGTGNRRQASPSGGRAGSLTEMSAQDANRAAALAPSAVREERDGSVVRAIAGCYAIRIGTWTPALNLDADSVYITPPRSIVLDTLPTAFPISSGFRVTPILDTPGRDYASWEPLQEGALRIIWTTGFSGIRMQLKLESDVLSGFATTFWDFSRASQRADVKGERVACQ